MNVIISVFCVLGSAVAIMFISDLGMAGWLQAAIIIPAVLLAVYSMARIQPKASGPGKDTGK